MIRRQRFPSTCQYARLNGSDCADGRTAPAARPVLTAAVSVHDPREQLRRCGLVCRVVLVVAVVLLDARRVLTRLGRRCLRRTLRLAPQSGLRWQPGCAHVFCQNKDYKSNKTLCKLMNSMYPRLKVHYRYIRMGRTQAPR
jgi:hypothetical protein